MSTRQKSEMCDVQAESVDDLPLIWAYKPWDDKFHYELRQVSDSHDIAVLVRVDTDLRSMDDGSHPKTIVKVGEYEFEDCVYRDPVSGEMATEYDAGEAFDWFGDWGGVSETDSPSGVDGSDITDLTREDYMLVLDGVTQHEQDFVMWFRFEQTLESLAVEEAIEL